MRLSTKIKGIFRVSTSNLLSLGLSMITSFILPLFISVEEYGYWQLFVLYNSYVGFFILGFNDGVHLNYATFDYDEKLAKKFNTFKRFLLVLTCIESLLLYLILILFFKSSSKEFYMLLIVVANLIPTAINGLFTYLNQATMRFNYYAVGTVIDKVLFTIIMLFLICFGIQDSMLYIISFTITRYLVIGYHFCTSRLVFRIKPESFINMKSEIVANFKNGFPLMIAVILGSSIVVGSRLLVKEKFGIASFGAFSFSIHTIVVASQFIGAIASVFYPILKRYPDKELGNVYVALDKSSSLLSAILLLSYYPIAIIILFLYTKYSEVLSYLMFVYPLFIFQCKSGLLITNVYKVKNKIFSLIIANAIGILLHLVFVFVAYYLFREIKSIAIAVLLSYGIWYYLFQTLIFKREGWRISSALPIDMIIITVFIIVNLFVQSIHPMIDLTSYLLGMSIFTIVLAIVFLLFRNSVKSVLLDINNILSD